MKNPFKKVQSNRNPSKALDSIKSLNHVFRPYYLNAEKINQYFDQEYAGLVEFSTTRGSEIAPSLGVSAEPSALANLIAKLRADITLSVKKSRDDAEKHELSSILRFVILRKYWDDQKRLRDIREMDVNTLSKPHTLISHTGTYRFAESIDAIKNVLNDDQFSAVQKQYQFEKHHEGEDHFLFLIADPLAISILSKTFITHTGYRYLQHFSEEESNTVFVGATIGFKHGLLFLDPICVGAPEPS